MRKRCLARLVALAVILNVALSGVAGAAALPSTDPGQGAGVTPDSFFYIFDRLFERLALFAARSPARRAELQGVMARERLAEAYRMAARQKQTFADAAAREYARLLLDLNETWGELYASGKNTKQLTKLLSTTDTPSETMQFILESVSAETGRSVRDAVSRRGATGLALRLLGSQQGGESGEDEDADEGETEPGERPPKGTQIIEAAIVERFGADPEEVAALTASLGYGEIVKVYSFAAAAGGTPEEVLALYGQIGDWGQVARELGLSMRVVGTGVGEVLAAVGRRAQRQDRVVTGNSRAGGEREQEREREQEQEREREQEGQAEKDKGKGHGRPDTPGQTGGGRGRNK